jgi:hypothetical protein
MLKRNVFVLEWMFFRVGFWCQFHVWFGMFSFCSHRIVTLGADKSCWYSKSSCVRELSAVLYHKCFLAERGKTLNCWVEDRHMNMKQIMNKNNGKFLHLWLRNNRRLYLVQWFPLILGCEYLKQREMKRRKESFFLCFIRMKDICLVPFCTNTWEIETWQFYHFTSLLSRRS